MTGHIYDITSEEARLFADIVGRLSTPGLLDVRENIFPDVLRLLRSDAVASYVWNPKTNSYDKPYVINQDPENIRKYQTWYQFRDPMTRKLRDLWRPAYVDEVISKQDLSKTEFYNDFLMKDDLDHGVNLFMRDGGKELADLRIWRRPVRADFGEREIGLLEVLAPYLRKAILTLPDVSLSLLTDRERDVALLVARGCVDKDIARVLGIGFATVRTHLSRCLEKMACSNRSELAALVTRLSH
ncbi:helix-turn-helix transcriptional regulator [Rhizobium bangladeshense]|uniref:response regulator transcription factor n=1 Tax=Rhizobium bangladeshense TaxID=1138189 RepID=UPI001C829DA1|nr:helix-turn-helix transcriptional regulator [Rhizobium bangladeshense]MBX4871018.1 helix-turn-helix transcriptional regulator [Rhizobium bangladeshense]MBX4871318.1 helix-turn-helix transcriptional regulator [Rhizobium bangladeshense]MBX4887582.1 helix-turn-helix transcriptional regulator [Rhizobium bangladeshense]